MQDNNTPDTNRAVLSLVQFERSLDKICPDDVYTLCSALHTVSTALMPVDSFYVCLYDQTTQMLAFVYNYDAAAHQQRDTPLVVGLGHGPTSYVIRSRRSYKLDFKKRGVQDGGVKFGNIEQSSQSALHVPICAGDSSDTRIIGVLSAQTYTENAYDEASLDVLEWLGQKAGGVLSRGKSEREKSSALAEALSLADQRLKRMISMVDACVRLHGDLNSAIDNVLNAVQGSPRDLYRTLDSLSEANHKLQSQIAWLPFLASEGASPRHATDPPDPLSALSVREREIFPYIAGGRPHHEIADILHISARTVKFHQENILKKLKLARRSDLARFLTAEGSARLMSPSTQTNN